MALWNYLAATMHEHLGSNPSQDRLQLYESLSSIVAQNTNDLNMRWSIVTDQLVVLHARP